LGKSPFSDDVRDQYQGEWHFDALSKTVIEVLRGFKPRKRHITKEVPGKDSDLELSTSQRTATDYSRMNYEQLRKIADNDAIADKMSDEEYESLSIELWREFSLEKVLK
jgi:hypothetical protein